MSFKNITSVQQQRIVILITVDQRQHTLFTYPLWHTCNDRLKQKIDNPDNSERVFRKILRCNDDTRCGNAQWTAHETACKFSFSSSANGYCKCFCKWSLSSMWLHNGWFVEFYWPTVKNSFWIGLIKTWNTVTVSLEQLNKININSSEFKTTKDSDWPVPRSGSVILVHFRFSASCKQFMIALFQPSEEREAAKWRTFRAGSFPPDVTHKLLGPMRASQIDKDEAEHFLQATSNHCSKKRSNKPPYLTSLILFHTTITYHYHRFEFKIIIRLLPFRHS